VICTIRVVAAYLTVVSTFNKQFVHKPLIDFRRGKAAEYLRIGYGLGDLRRACDVSHADIGGNGL